MTVVSDDFEFNLAIDSNIKKPNRVSLTQWDYFDSIRMDDAVRCHGKLAKINNGTIAVLKVILLF
jgi:hypothetical protein